MKPKNIARLLTTTAIIATTTIAISAALEQKYALSTTIGGSQIIPSTSLPTLSPFTIGKIADGITSDASPFNGFASTASSGTIRLNLVSDFDLRSFIIWNDINVQGQGVKDFRLDFFNSANSQISPGFSTSFIAPFSQLAPGEYVFDRVIPGVRRVDLVVLNSYPSLNRIEIREVAFTTGSISSPTTSVPEPFTIVGTLIGGTAALRLRKKLKAESIDKN